MVDVVTRVETIVRHLAFRRQLRDTLNSSAFRSKSFYHFCVDRSFAHRATTGLRRGRTSHSGTTPTETCISSNIKRRCLHAKPLLLFLPSPHAPHAHAHQVAIPRSVLSLRRLTWGHGRARQLNRCPCVLRAYTPGNKGYHVGMVLLVYRTLPTPFKT